MRMSHLVHSIRVGLFGYPRRNFRLIVNETKLLCLPRISIGEAVREIRDVNNQVSLPGGW